MAKKLLFDNRVVNLDRVKVYKQDGNRILFDEQVHIPYENSKQAEAMFNFICNFEDSRERTIVDMSWELSKFIYRLEYKISKFALNNALMYGHITNDMIRNMEEPTGVQTE